LRKLALQLVGSLVLGASMLLSQTTSTEVLGTVSDTSGAIVPGAKVTLLRVGTGEKRTAVSDGSGNYSFPLIDIGDYTVAVEMQGFKSQTVTGVHVEYQQKARVNVQLDVGAASERVEVVASGIELKTDDGTDTGCPVRNPNESGSDVAGRILSRWDPGQRQRPARRQSARDHGRRDRQ
jgi:hypothetical protein